MNSFEEAGQANQATNGPIPMNAVQMNAGAAEWKPPWLCNVNIGKAQPSWADKTYFDALAEPDKQEKEQAARLDRKLKREENVESNMPQVLDYVQQKADQFELERTLAAWKRKVDIAEMEYKRYEGIARKGAIM